MSKKFLFEIKQDDLYRLLNALPFERDLAILSIWNGSFHDSYCYLYLSIRSRSLERIEKIASELGISLVSAKGTKVSEGTFVPQSRFIIDYEKHRDREIVPIERNRR